MSNKQWKKFGMEYTRVGQLTIFKICGCKVYHRISNIHSLLGIEWGYR